MMEGQPLENVEGVKYLDLLLPLLNDLHRVGCQRDKAGNRRLHFDQYCLLVLLFLFNPMVRSLRALQRVSELKQVQRKLGCSRTSLGSLSEAVDVFEPQRLQGIIEELFKQLPPAQHVSGEHLHQTLTAVDGSIVKTLVTIAEAAYLTDKNGCPHSGWRFHTHFDVDRGVPTRMDVTSARNGGKTSEKSMLSQTILPDRCYVMDRGYVEFALWNKIVAAGSSYVCRIRGNLDLSDVVEERPVSEAARQAGVLRDVVVRLGNDQPEGARPNHRVRVVMVRETPHARRSGRHGRRAGPSSDGILRIATNLLDVPAEVISDVYRHRWTIELFFRFFKHVLGCRHLLSTDPVGIQIQAYCAIIACLLISLWTGGKPTLRTYEMLCFYFMGWADLEELNAHLATLKPQTV
jgi:hypothetical protein